MDAAMLALTGVASATVVQLLVTESWQIAKAGLGRLWRDQQPEQADVIEGEIARGRSELMAARPDDAPLIEQALTAEFDGRLQRLLIARPEQYPALRKLVDEELRPLLPAAGQIWHGNVTMSATATNNSRVHQVGQGTQISNEH